MTGTDQRKFGSPPAYTGYTAYDDVYIIRKQSSALARPIPTRWSTSWKRPNFEGPIGRIQFYGKDDEFTHGIKSGPGYVTGLVFQWQNEKQITVWPEKIAEGKLKFPGFREDVAVTVKAATAARKMFGESTR